MIQIIPAIDEQTENGFLEKLQKVESLEAARHGWLHLDFADGDFVPVKTVHSTIVKKYPTHLNIEAHLMVKHPLEWIEPLLDMQIKRVIIHQEIGEKELDKFFTQKYSEKMQVGLAVNPETSVETISSFLSNLTSVLIMTIHPGPQGNPFLPEMLEKIRSAVALRMKSGTHFLIGADGSMNENTIGDAILAGIDYAVIGSALVKGDISQNYQKILERI